MTPIFPHYRERQILVSEKYVTVLYTNIDRLANMYGFNPDRAYPKIPGNVEGKIFRACNNRADLDVNKHSSSLHLQIRVRVL